MVKDLATDKPRVQGHISQELYDQFKEELTRRKCYQSTLIEEALEITLGLDSESRETLEKWAASERRTFSQQILTIVEEAIRQRSL